MQSDTCACQPCCCEEFDLLQASMTKSNDEKDSQMSCFLTLQEYIPALACPAAWVVSTAADPAAWSEQPKPLCSPASWRLRWRLPPPTPLSRCAAPPPTSATREVVRYNMQRCTMERWWLTALDSQMPYGDVFSLLGTASSCNKASSTKHHPQAA